MSRLKPGEVERFLANYAGDPAIVLVHGANEGLVRRRVRSLIARLLGPSPDPLSLVPLEAETIAADPGRLMDEANTIPLLGGRRVIHVRAHGRFPARALEPLLQKPPQDAILILDADDLAKGSPLRAMCEKSPAAAVIPCFPDGPRDLGALVDARIATANLVISAAARQDLVSALSDDHALATGEIDKLILYTQGIGSIQCDDIAAIVAEVGNANISGVVDLAFAGAVRDVETEANRMFREGAGTEGILRAATTHAALLTRALSSGAAPAEALPRLGLHFRREERVRQHFRLWTLDRLERVSAIVHDATVATRLTPRLAEPITMRALWSIALAAQRKTPAGQQT